MKVLGFAWWNYMLDIRPGLSFRNLTPQCQFLGNRSDLWGGGGPLERLGDLLFNMEIARYTSSKQGVCLCVFSKMVCLFLKWNQIRVVDTCFLFLHQVLSFLEPHVRLERNLHIETTGCMSSIHLQRSCVCFFEGMLQTHVVWLSWSTSYFFQLLLPPSVHKKQIQPQMIHVCVSCFCVATSEGVFIINLQITRFKLAPQKMWHVSFPEASKKCGSPSHRSEQNRIGLLGGYSLTNSSVFFSGSCEHSYNSQQWRAPTGAGRPSCLDTKVPQCAVADHHWLLHGLASGGIYHAHGAKSPPTPTSPRVAALTAGSVP